MVPGSKGQKSGAGLPAGGNFDLRICPVSMGAGDHLPPYVCYGRKSREGLQDTGIVMQNGLEDKQLCWRI